MNLSPHFTLAELTRTSRAEFAAVNSAPPANVEAALRALCGTILEPVRAQFGPVSIHSGYRCPGLNAAVGSSDTSQHPRGEAADFHCSGASLVDVWRWIALHHALPFGQVILEGGRPGAWGWVHVSLGEPWRPRERCRQVLVIDPTGTRAVDARTWRP